MIVRKMVSVVTDTDIPATEGLWVGGAGNVHVRFVDGTEETIQGVQAGTLLPIGVTRVFRGATTATLLMAVYATGR